MRGKHHWLVTTDHFQSMTTWSQLPNRHHADLLLSVDVSQSVLINYPPKDNIKNVVCTKQWHQWLKQLVNYTFHISGMTTIFSTYAISWYPYSCCQPGPTYRKHNKCYSYWSIQFMFIVALMQEWAIQSDVNKQLSTLCYPASILGPPHTMA